MTKQVELMASQGKLRAELYALSAVVHEEPLEEGGWQLTIQLSKTDFERLFNSFR